MTRFISIKATVAALAVVFLFGCAAPAPTPTPVPPTSTPMPTATDTPLPSPTNTLAPTAASTPADTTLAFADDFGPTCSLTQVDDANHTYKCENGEYQMQGRIPNYAWWVNYRSAVYSDIVMEVDAHAISGPASFRYGVVFRLASQDYYSVTLDRDGSYAVFRHTQDKWTYLIPDAPANAIKPDTAINHLKIIAQGNHIAVYVNDQWLNTVTDSALSQGSIGFILDQGDPNAKAGFSHLRVSRINNPFTLPAGLVPTATPAPCGDLPPGVAGLLYVNVFSQEATVTIVDHEYRVPASSQMVIPIPAGKPFTVDAFIPGVGRLRPALGPFTLDAGECRRLQPHN